MDEQKKKNRRKILTRTLILAACILVIAAITVTTIFAVNDWGHNDIHIDQQNPDDSTADKPGNQGNTGNQGNQGNTGNQGNQGNTGNEGDGGNQGSQGEGDKDKPTSSADEFASPVAEVDIVTGFDFGKDVTLGHWHFHTGLDMLAEQGTDVMACLDGTVEKIVVGDKLDGTSVTISHANGLKTVYTFIDAKEGLKEGDKVTRGQIIGTVAEANGSEYLVGSHLHFEVYKDGELADPNEYLSGSIK